LLFTGRIGRFVGAGMAFSYLGFTAAQYLI
jgi:hypothetical protein